MTSNIAIIPVQEAFFVGREPLNHVTCTVQQVQWIVERSHGRAYAPERPLGWMPRFEYLNWKGLEDFCEGDFVQAMSIDRDDWNKEISPTPSCPSGSTIASREK